MKNLTTKLYGMLFIMLLIPAISNAEVCYDIAKENSFDLEFSESLETWCFEDFGQSGYKYRYIYNVDDGVDKKLSYLLSYKGSKPVDVTHGYMSGGDFKIIKDKISDFNPLPIPMELQNSFKAKVVFLNKSNQAKKTQILNNLLSKSKNKSLNTASLYTLEAGVFESSLPTEKHPFKGKYWPFDGGMYSGSHSPLAMYDSIAGNFYDNWTPKSVEWEKEHHGEGPSWACHCNGWAASAVLYEEPVDTLWDEYNEKVITAHTLKGLLTEASFCVNWAFYGHRYRGPESDSKDIYADKFHKVLLYYINKQQKAVAIDTEPGLSVENALISGYKFDITKVEGEDKKFLVNARLQMHYYGESGSGKATIRYSNYSYYLNADSQGKIESGEWASKNPDFLWVPLSEKDCGRENPHVKKYAVDKILNFPKAEMNEIYNVFNFDGELEDSATVDIPLELKKYLEKGSVDYSAHGASNIYLYFEYDYNGQIYKDYIGLRTGDIEGADFGLLNRHGEVLRLWLRVYAPASTPTDTPEDAPEIEKFKFNFNINKISYLGPPINSN